MISPEEIAALAQFYDRYANAFERTSPDRLLARQMIRLCGLEPDRDIEIKFVGLRPGEKLFEELKHLYADCASTVHPRILRLTSSPMPLEAVRAFHARLQEVPDSATPEQFRLLLATLLPEYTSWKGERAVPA